MEEKDYVKELCALHTNQEQFLTRPTDALTPNKLTSLRGVCHLARNTWVAGGVSGDIWLGQAQPSNPPEPSWIWVGACRHNGVENPKKRTSTARII